MAVNPMVFFSPFFFQSGAPVVTASQYPLTDSSELCKIDPPTATGVFLKDYTCDRQGVSSVGDYYVALLPVNVM